MYIIHLVKISLLALIICEVHFILASGLQSGLHRERSSFRASRHSARGGGSHKKQRPTACIPDEGYNNQLDAESVNGSETEQKRDLSPNSSNEDSWEDSSYDSANSNEDSIPTNSSVNAISPNSSNEESWEDSSYDPANSNENSIPTNSSVNDNSDNYNLSSINFGKISQNINGSQFNNSLPEAMEVTKNFSSFNMNQSQEINSTNLDNFSSGFLSELPENGMKKSEVFLGFLPDDGSSGGTRQTMAQLNSAIGTKAAVYGWYAQVHSGVPFDGSQLLPIIDDVKACNCVFQPAIMPIGGWQGLTSWDNSQAIAIAQVLKNFTDEGIPVWLRFAHEVNYYQTDGTYQGTASDFKAGWAAVADAIKKITPSVKMWWTPNVSTEEDYAKYEPDDMSTVDLVGIDYYPKKLSGSDFLNAMKDFHDKYAVDGRKFAIGETGLGWSGSLDDKVKWFNEICEAKKLLPEFISMAWFNFDKEYDYKIAGEPTLNQKFTSLIAT